MRLLLPAVFILLLAATPTWAVLGQSAASISSDQQHLGGERRSIAADAFSVEEITSASGTVVREFVSPGGQVFAVAWRGPVRPDLRQLLGEHFAAFERAAAAPGHGRRALAVRTDALVVESGGHVRDFRGRAYLPALMPEGVSPTAVR
jgi:Protein of unknown function (DUF2844)